MTAGASAENDRCHVLCEGWYIVSRTYGTDAGQSNASRSAHGQEHGGGGAPEMHDQVYLKNGPISFSGATPFLGVNF